MDHGYESLVYLTVAFVYVLFVSLLVDKLLGYEDMENMCKNMYGKDQSLFNKCSQLRDDFALKKFSIMVLFGVTSIFTGMYLAKNNTKLQAGGFGMALGGALAVLYFVMVNWTLLSNNVRLTVLGISLGTLFVGPMYM